MTESNGDLHCAEQPSDATKGDLVFLKTKLETRPGDRLVSVHVTTVPVKLASSALKLIREILPNDGGIDLQHLRRFAKYHDVNDHVRSAHAASSAKNELPKVFLVVAAKEVATQQFLAEALSPKLGSLEFFSIEVPLLAPTSQEQASLWTSRYWPTVYKKSNPFGPHPSIISRAEDEIQDDIEKWMALATDVARQSQVGGIGEAFGVVVVERLNGHARPVAVAGDARWLDWPKASCGNPTAHATLRAIDMVAQQVRRSHQVEEEQAKEAMDGSVGIFRGQPNLSIEKENFRASTDQEGYLCHGLEIYCTHEPCVMCSMAIVHSRFGRVIFEHRMDRTGGLCADGELGHGLFWRKELNWQLLAWQWFRPTPDIDVDRLRISDDSEGPNGTGSPISSTSALNA